MGVKSYSSQVGSGARKQEQTWTSKMIHVYYQVSNYYLKRLKVD